jgi:hypothetical protein
MVFQVMSALARDTLIAVSLSMLCHIAAALQGRLPFDQMGVAMLSFYCNQHCRLLTAATYGCFRIDHHTLHDLACLMYVGSVLLGQGIVGQGDICILLMRLSRLGC